MLYPEPLQIDFPEKEINNTKIDKNEERTNLCYPTRERRKSNYFIVENFKHNTT